MSTADRNGTWGPNFANRRLEAPRHEPADVVHQMVQVGLNSVPVLGSVASALFRTLFQDPYDARAQAWMELVTERLLFIESQQAGFIDGLCNRPDFITLVGEASRTAARDHSTEKTEALLNIVLNGAVSPDAHADLRQTVVGLLAQMTATHVRLMKRWADPATDIGWTPVVADPVTGTIVDEGNGLKKSVVASESSVERPSGRPKTSRAFSENLRMWKRTFRYQFS